MIALQADTPPLGLCLKAQAAASVMGDWLDIEIVITAAASITNIEANNLLKETVVIDRSPKVFDAPRKR